MDRSAIEHYYSAETSPRGFGYHALRAFSLIGVTRRHWTLFKHFFGRDLTARFQGTALGPAWVLVQPLFLFCVYYVVFGIGFRQTLGGLHPGYFALYLFSGIVCFHAITGATSAAMISITSNSNLVKKVVFPSELLPMVPAVVETTVFVAGFGVALAIGATTGILAVDARLFALPLFLLVMVTLVAGIGFLLANSNVFVRDVRQLYAIVTMPWMFLSPNFWAPGNMLIGDIAWVEPWMAALNPAYCLLLAERQILGMDDPSLGIVRNVWTNLGIAGVWAVGLFILGYGSFMAQKRKHADVV